MFNIIIATLGIAPAPLESCLLVVLAYWCRDVVGL
jgi:hypothetical protein